MWKQAASTVEHGGNRSRIRGIIIEESPVSIMPVKVSKQGVYNENIPEVFPQDGRGYILLFIDSIHHIREFCASTVAVRFQDGVLDRTEIKETFTSCCEVLTCTDNLFFVSDGIGAEHCLLGWDSNEIKNTAGDMLANTTVCV